MKVPNHTIGCITQLTENGVEQTVDFFGETVKRAVNVHAAQMEAGFRSKLIELGWTPPRDSAMTTTEEVPMPEPDYCLHNLPQNPLYGPTKLRAYAEARCAKLQAELANMRQHVISIAGQLQAERIERDALAGKVKAMEDDARRVFALYPRHWDRVEGGLFVDASNVAEFDAAFEALGVRLGLLVEDNEDDAAIDAAGGDQC